MYHEPQQQFDNYGNPINYENNNNYQQSAPQYPPQQPQQQQMYQEEQQFVRRDAYSSDPNSSMGPPQNVQQSYSRIRSESGGGGEERILRNPHPHIPLGRDTQETYDPSLPAYNATPIYRQPQQQVYNYNFLKKTL
jgi:hypothetical protein